MAKYSQTVSYDIKTTYDASGLSSFQSEIQKIERKLSQMGEMDLLSKSQVSKAKSQLQELRNALNSSFNVNLGMMDTRKLTTNLRQAKLSITELGKSFSLAGTEGKLAFNQLLTSVGQLDTGLVNTSRSVEKIFTTLGNTVRWGVIASGFQMVMNSIHDSVQYMRDLDTSLTNIMLVSDYTKEDMREFALYANDAAEALGNTTVAYTDAALIYAQQGYNLEDQKKLADITLKVANVTGQETAQVSEQLTAIINGYQLAVDDIETSMDKIGLIANISAADVEELAVAASRVAATANTLGESQDELYSQIATIVSVTREAPEVIGNALKTIMTRLGDIKLGETLEDGVNLGTYAKALDSIGVSVLNANGELRDMGDIVEDLMGRWQSLTTAEKEATAVTVAGRFQSNRFMVLMENQDMYKQYLEATTEAEGTLNTMQGEYLDSLEGKTAQMQAAFENLLTSLINQDDFGGVIDGIRTALDLITDLVDAIGGGQVALEALGAIAVRVFSQQIGHNIANIVRNVQNTRTAAQNREYTITQLQTLGYNQAAIANPQATTTIDYASETAKYEKFLSTQQLEQRNKLLSQGKEILNEQVLAEDKFNQTLKNTNELMVILNENNRTSEGTPKNLAINYDKVNKILINTEQLSYMVSQNFLDIMPDNAGFYNMLGTIDDVQSKLNQVIDTTNRLGDSPGLDKTQAEFTNIQDKINTIITSLREYVGTGIDAQTFQILGTNQGQQLVSLEMAEKYQNAIKELAEAWNAVERSETGAQQRFQQALSTISPIVNEHQQILSQINDGQYARSVTELQRLGDQYVLAGDQVNAFNRVLETELGLFRQERTIVNFTSAIGNLGQVAIGLQSLSNLTSVVGDNELDNYEKFSRIIMDLSFSLPMVVSGISTLSGDLRNGSARASAFSAQFKALSADKNISFFQRLNLAAANANRELGIAPTRVSKFGTALRGLATSTPVLLAVSLAIEAIMMAFNAWQEHQKEVQESIAEATEKAKESTSTLVDSKANFNDLFIQYKEGKINSDELKEAAESLNQSLQDQKLNVYAATEQWNLYEQRLNSITTTTLQQNLHDLYNGLNQVINSEEYTKAIDRVESAAKNPNVDESYQIFKDGVQYSELTDLEAAMAGSAKRLRDQGNTGEADNVDTMLNDFKAKREEINSIIQNIVQATSEIIATNNDLLAEEDDTLDSYLDKLINSNYLTEVPEELKEDVAIQIATALSQNENYANVTFLLSADFDEESIRQSQDKIADTLEDIFTRAAKSDLDEEAKRELRIKVSNLTQELTKNMSAEEAAEAAAWIIEAEIDPDSLKESSDLLKEFTAQKFIAKITPQLDLTSEAGDLKDLVANQEAINDLIDSFSSVADNGGWSKQEAAELIAEHPEYLQYLTQVGDQYIINTRAVEQFTSGVTAEINELEKLKGTMVDITDLQSSLKDLAGSFDFWDFYGGNPEDIADQIDVEKISEKLKNRMFGRSGDITDTDLQDKFFQGMVGSYEEAIKKSEQLRASTMNVAKEYVNIVNENIDSSNMKQFVDLINDLGWPQSADELMDKITYFNTIVGDVDDTQKQAMEDLSVSIDEINASFEETFNVWEDAQNSFASGETDANGFLNELSNVFDRLDQNLQDAKISFEDFAGTVTGKETIEQFFNNVTAAVGTVARQLQAGEADMHDYIVTLLNAASTEEEMIQASSNLSDEIVNLVRAGASQETILNAMTASQDKVTQAQKEGVKSLIDLRGQIEKLNESEEFTAYTEQFTTQLSEMLDGNKAAQEALDSFGNFKSQYSDAVNGLAQITWDAYANNEEAQKSLASTLGISDERRQQIFSSMEAFSVELRDGDFFSGVINDQMESTGDSVNDFARGLSDVVTGISEMFQEIAVGLSGGFSVTGQKEIPILNFPGMKSPLTMKVPESIEFEMSGNSSTVSQETIDKIAAGAQAMTGSLSSFLDISMYLDPKKIDLSAFQKKVEDTFEAIAENIDVAITPMDEINHLLEVEQDNFEILEQQYENSGSLDLLQAQEASLSRQIGYYKQLAQMAASQASVQRGMLSTLYGAGFDRSGNITNASAIQRQLQVEYTSLARQYNTKGLTSEQREVIKGQLEDVKDKMEDFGDLLTDYWKNQSQAVAGSQKEINSLIQKQQSLRFTPEHTDYIESDVDLYGVLDAKLRDVENTLSRVQKQYERTNNAELLDEQRKIIERQIQLLKEKLVLQQREAAVLRQQLATMYGISFDSEGYIANYVQRYNSYLNLANQIVDRMNRSQTEKQYEYWEDYLARVQKQMDGLNDLVSRYNSVAYTGDIAAEIEDATYSLEDLYNDQEKYEPKHLDRLDDEIDRYQQIETLLTRIGNIYDRVNAERERSVGRKYLSALRDELSIMHDQIIAQREKLALQQQEAAELRNELSSSWGVNFDDQGYMINVADIHQQLINNVNDAIDNFNNATTEAEQDEWQKVVDEAKEALEDFKDAYTDYNEVFADGIESTINELEELEDKIEDIKLEALETQIQAVDNLKDLQETLIEFNAVFSGLRPDDPFRGMATSVQKLESYFDTATDSMHNFYNTLRQDIYAAMGGDISDTQARFFQQQLDMINQAQYQLGQGTIEGYGTGYLDMELLNLTQVIDAIYDMQATGNSIFGENAAELYELAQDVFKSATQMIQDYESEIEELRSQILDGIADIGEAMADRRQQYQNITDELEHQRNIMEMLRGDKNYGEIDQVLSAQQYNYQAAIKSMQQQLDLWKEMLGTLEEGSDEWKAVNEQIISTQKELNSLVETSLKNMEEKYKNTVNSVLDSWIESALGSGDLDWLDTQWELINRNSDYYLDNVNAAYEIQKLESKYKDLLDGTDDLLTQQQITEQMNQQLGYLREKDQLSKYDIEYAQAQLEILQRQIALEEAQRAKNQMELRRDSQGNYSYQYVADDQQTSDQEMALLEAQNNAYNLSKEQMIQAQKDSLEALKQARDQLLDIWTDANLTLEEKQERTQEIIDMLKEYLAGTGEQLATSERNIIIDFLEMSESLTEENGERIREVADQLRQDIADAYLQLKEDTYTSYEELSENTAAILDILREHNYEIFDQLKADTFDAFNLIDDRYSTSIQQWLDNLQNFNYSTQDAFNSLVNAANQYDMEVQNLSWSVRQNFNDITWAVQDARNATNDLTNSEWQFANQIRQDMYSIENYIQSLRRFANELMNLSNSMMDYQYKVQELGNVLRQQAIENANMVAEVQAQFAQAQSYTDAYNNYSSGYSSYGGGYSSGGTSYNTSPSISYDSGGSYNNNAQAAQAAAAPRISAKSWVGFHGWYYYDSEGHSPAGHWFAEQPGRVMIDSVRNDVGPYSVHLSAPNDGCPPPAGLGWVKPDQIFDTGGYTGTWSGTANPGTGNGRLAFLHQKELVLNAQDTQNILGAVTIIREISEGFKARMLAGNVNNYSAQTTSLPLGGTVDQNVSITAEFPNASDANEIREALNSLVDQAYMYSRKNFG